MKRKIIAWSLVFAIVLGFLGLAKLLSKEKVVQYGYDGVIGFTELDTDITEQVKSNSLYTVAENSDYAMRIDGNANISILHKTTGHIWNAVPQSDEGNSKYSSSLIFDYYSNNATKVTMYSSENSVDKGQFKVFSAENGVKVEYIFGEMAADYVFPEIISKERMELFFEKMSEDDIAYIERRYTLYELERFEGEERTYILSEYPRLEKEDIYVLTDNNIKLTGKKVDKIFRSAGYTEQDRVSDNAGGESETERTHTFKLSVNYVLTQTGFKAFINQKNCEFYSEYPISKIRLLPYFDAFANLDTGYMVIPSGSGAVAEINKEKSSEEKTLSLPIYSDNISLTQKINETSQQCTLPVFGEYKQNSSYLAVVDEGSQQASIEIEKNNIYSSASVSFDFIDNQEISLSSKNPVWLFSSCVSDEKFGVEYILFPQTSQDTAYSEMANVYRERLTKEGLLPDKTNDDEPDLLAEIVNTVNFDRMVLGCFPKNSEFALTTFEDTQKITENILKFTESENLNVLLTGWNSHGLNRQGYSKVDFSGAAGGKNGFINLKNSLADKNVNLYCDMNFTVFEQYLADGYSPSGNSARGLSNSITSISVLNSQTNSYAKTNLQLISPKLYEKLWKSYSENESIKDLGLGVSQLTSYLYSDYSNNTAFLREDSQKAVEKILGNISSDNRKIIGNAGNLYSLKYMTLVNNLSSMSNQNNIFDYDIPFVQMVLHGYVEYVSSPLNDAPDARKAVLKAIENGEGLHIRITANKFDKLFETDFSALYNTVWSDNEQEFAECYNMLKDALSGLANQEIISHSYITEEVTCTEYANGTKVYVNYGDKVYNKDGITVEALSYTRV